MDDTLGYGLKEESGAGEFLYDSVLFSADGPYSSALRELDKLINRTPNASQSDILRLRLRVIHECEEAKRWNQITADDYPTAQVKRGDSVGKAFDTAVMAVRVLRAVDREEPFFFRDAIKGALEEQIGPERPLKAWVSNPNLDEGGTLLEANGPTKHHIEHQLVRRIALFGLGELLAALESRLGEKKREAAPWRKIGPLRVNPSLSRRQVAKLDVDILGLSARLAYVFREWTAGRGVTPYWPGLEMPTDGLPNWKLAAEFVNAALNPNKMQDEETLRKRWADFTSARSVRLDPWPRKAVREPQTKKKKSVADRLA